MKAPLTALAALIFCFCSSSLFAELKLAEKGKSLATIVVAPDASKTVRHAATELGMLLKDATGGRFEIAGAPKPGTVSIFVGAGAAKMGDPQFSSDGLGTDGIVIQTLPNGLILAGGEPRGTLYAVYEFLEDVVGFRWLTPKVTVNPAKDTLLIGDLNQRYTPVFEFREIVIAPNTTDVEWSVRNKCIGELHGYGNFAAMAERGGNKKAHPSGHTFFYVLPPEKYFATHPDWYSLIEGKRVSEPSVHASLCLTNKQMLREFEKNLLNEIKNAPAIYAKASPDYAAWVRNTEQPFFAAAVAPNDDSGYPNRCQCEDCVAIEQAEGSPAGLVLRLVNQMAEATEKKFPDTSISTYAYHYTQKPPTLTKPNPNVIVYFAPIHLSYSKPITDERNRQWKDDLFGWLKLSKRIYIYDYPCNVSFEQTPHPNLPALAENIRFYAENGVVGYFGEGILNSGTGGTELAELRAWVIAKLLWNPKADLNKLIKEFCDGYYGPASDEVVAYINVMNQAVQRSGDWLGLSSPPDAKFLNIETLTEAWTHLQAAEQAVRNDPDLLARVQNVQVPVMFVLLARWNELKNFAADRGLKWPLKEKRKDAYSDFIQIVQKNGITLFPGTKEELAKDGKHVGVAPL